MLPKGKDISYAGCGLPYYVGGAIPERDQLIVNTPEKYSALTGAMVYPQREVVSLDTATKRQLRKIFGQEQKKSMNMTPVLWQ